MEDISIKNQKDSEKTKSPYKILYDDIKKFRKYEVIDELFLSNNQIIFHDNIMKSESIIIKLFKEDNQNNKNQLYIVCFYESIIIIPIFLLDDFISLISANNKSIIYYFLDAKNILENKIYFKKKKILISETNVNSSKNIDIHLYDEISSIYESFPFNNEFDNIQQNNKSILLCIYSYLIKQSYSKLNKIQSVTIQSWNEDDYIELRNIGHGSSSSVKLIYHIKNRELYAIKKFINDPQDKLYKREINNYLTIHHTNLPKLYAFDNKNKEILIQFINGKTLIEAIEHDKLSFEEKTKIIFQILKIFNYLHNNDETKFVYRDLKPSNIIIENKTNKAYLIDFDQMIKEHYLQENRENSNSFGSYFVDPEIVNNGIINYKCDIYSIGKLICYIINNKIPNDPVNLKSFQNNKQLYSIYKNCTGNISDRYENILDLIFIFYSFFVINCNDNELYINKFMRILSFDEEYIRLNVDYAIHYLTIAANHNNSNAQYILGMIYYDDKYKKNDIQKSISYLTSASSDDRKRKAQFQLATIYYEGKNITRNIEKSIHYFLKAANSEKIVISGEIISNKRGVMPIIEKIIQAQFNLGVIYYEGKYIKQDIKKAIKFLDYAEKNDYTMAQFLLGLIYLTGEFIDQDIRKAMNYFDKASKKKNPYAQYILGMIYLNGKFVNKDIKEAKKNFLRWL